MNLTGVSGHDDGRQVGAALTKLLQELPAPHARHRQIGYQGFRGISGIGLQCLDTVACDRHPMSFNFQRVLKHQRDQSLIFG
ncbi:hypothetical protein N825_05750 [Skermanella stibiiresistens SB22]|uniref:Uncharacterized protein n=1 Tax=Skermanella stibiiresistens SB22 TaxID=1385369 RepID=W9H4R4_9PROT|nr:hypothetical protein N825_05750 [Skermanella stibiiresistens SB22]